MQPSPSGLRVIPEGQMHMKVPIKFLHIMPLDSQSWRPSAHSSRSVKIHVFEHPFSSFIYWRQPALFHEKNASRLSYETRTKKKQTKNHRVLCITVGVKVIFVSWKTISPSWHSCITFPSKNTQNTTHWHYVNFEGVNYLLCCLLHFT